MAPIFSGGNDSPPPPISAICCFRKGTSSSDDLQGSWPSTGQLLGSNQSLKLFWWQQQMEEKHHQGEMLANRPGSPWNRRCKSGLKNPNPVMG